MPSLTLDISPKSDLSRRILDGVRGRIQASKRKYQDRHNKWREAEDRVLATQFSIERAVTQPKT